MTEIVAENISIINSAELEGATRIDAEYYQPKYIEQTKILLQNKTELLDNLSEKILNFGAYSLCNQIKYVTDGIPYLFVGNIKENCFDLTDIKFIDKKTHDLLSKSQITKNQILLTIAGTIGNAVVAYGLPDKINSNQAIANIYLKPKHSPFYVSTFLNSQYGKYQTQRLVVSNVQPNLLLVQVKSLKVPLVEPTFEKEIEQTILKALDLLNNSNLLYSQAETLLLEELGIKDIDLSHESCYEVNSADTIHANRIDAEYYQPKYERVIEAIKKHPYKSIGEMFHLIKGIEPGSSVYCEEGKPFIRVSNLNKFEINNDNQQYLSQKTYTELKTDYQPLKGEILLSKDATPGIAYHLKDQIHGIISSGILRLQALSNIKREYICLVIDSIVGQSQIERDSGGSVINHWKPSQVKNTLIPLLPDKIQERIESLCLESHFARRQAKELLEQAKWKVEEMIEKGNQI